MDLFIAPSRYFGNLMRERLGLPADRVRVVHNGINLDGYETDGQSGKSEVRSPKSEVQGAGVPVLGFFARMCPEKGLDTLVEAYILLRQRGRAGNLKLRVGRQLRSGGPGVREVVARAIGGQRLAR